MKIPRGADVRDTVIGSEVCVLWLRLNGIQRDTVADWLSVLDESERARAERYRYAQDRDSFVAAHALVRHGLSTMTGHPPAKWRFRAAAGGKPVIDTAPSEFEDEEAPRFNLSHCRGMVAVAFHWRLDVGVDVEALSHQIPADFWERVFGPMERQSIAGLAAGQRAPALMALWTQKEALVKASGQGLRGSLSSIVCTLEPPQLQTPGFLPGTPQEWQLWQMRVENAFVMTAATRNQSEKPVRCRFIEVDV